MRAETVKHLMNYIVEGELVVLYFGDVLISNECYAEEDTAPVGYEGDGDWYTFAEDSNVFRVSVASESIHAVVAGDGAWVVCIHRPNIFTDPNAKDYLKQF